MNVNVSGSGSVNAGAVHEGADGNARRGDLRGHRVLHARHVRHARRDDDPAAAPEREPKTA